MKKTVVFLIAVNTTFYACSGSGKKGQENTILKDSLSVKNSLTPPVKPDSVAIASDSTIVQLSITDGKGKVQAHKNKGQTIYIRFESNRFKKLSAQLSSQDLNANVRFSQIKLPDGTMDGPFGQKMDYTLPSDGVYTLSVNENIMAGDPWEGDFTVEVVLSK